MKAPIELVKDPYFFSDPETYTQSVSDWIGLSRSGADNVAAPISKPALTIIILSAVAERFHWQEGFRTSPDQVHTARCRGSEYT